MTTPFGLLPNGTVPDPKLEHASDHRERAIGVLLSQLRDKPRFTKLIEILIRPFQEIEDVIFQLYTMRRLDSAQGVQLDIIGRIVDEERGGLLDDDYRAIIRIKVRVLFSRGTGPDLIKITQLFLASDDFNYAEFYPATVEITATALVTAAQLTLLKRFLRRAKSGGGLGTRFHYGTEGTGVGYGVGTYGGVI
jgi:hypothetical protein